MKANKTITVALFTFASLLLFSQAKPDRRRTRTIERSISNKSVEIWKDTVFHIGKPIFVNSILESQQQTLGMQDLVIFDLNKKHILSAHETSFRGSGRSLLGMLGNASSNSVAYIISFEGIVGSVLMIGYNKEKLLHELIKYNIINPGNASFNKAEAEKFIAENKHTEVAFINFSQSQIRLLINGSNFLLVPNANMKTCFLPGDRIAIPSATSDEISISYITITDKTKQVSVNASGNMIVSD